MSEKWDLNWFHGVSSWVDLIDERRNKYVLFLLGMTVAENLHLWTDFTTG